MAGELKMDVREKLVELIIKSGEICYSHTAEELASHLIAHGVTVQSEIDANTYQIMRECERLKEQNESLGNAVNVLEEINSDLCKKFKGVTVQEWISVKDSLPNVNTNKSGYESKGVTVLIEGRKKSAYRIYERACNRGKTVYRWKYPWDRISDEHITHWCECPNRRKENDDGNV